MADLKLSNAAVEAITELPETALLYAVINPSTTPVSKKITTANARKSLLATPYASVVHVPPSGDDDYTALAAALAAATPGTTILLRGAYSTSDTLTIADAGVVIDGYGATLTQTGTNKPTILVNSVANVTIQGLSLGGLGSETPWAEEATTRNAVAAIQLTAATNAKILNCRMTNHAGGSIFLSGACSGIVITGNTIVGMTVAVITEGDNGHDACIDGEALSVGKTDILISDNDLSGHCFGILLPGVIDLTITGNSIHDIPGQHGIYLTNGGDQAITGNSITDCAQNGIKVQPQVEEDIESVTNISCNTITRCGDCGVMVLGTSSGAFYTKNVSIVGNNIYDVCSNASAPSAGIFLREARKAHVAGNRVRKSGYYGLYANLSEAQFVANYVAECEGCALYVDTPNNYVIVNDLISVDAPLNLGEAAGYNFRSVVFMTDEASPNQGTVHIGGLHARFVDGTAKAGTGAFFSCLYPNANTLLRVTGPIVDWTGPAYAIGTMAGVVEHSEEFILGNTAPTYGTNKAFVYAADVAAGRTSIHAMTEEGHIVKLFRGAAVADCTNTTDVITQLNALLARLRVTGGNGMIAD